MNNISTIPQNPLINVFNAVIDGVNQLSVNARDLHSFLEVGRDFSTWIKSRIDEYKFAVNLDFISFPQIGGKPSKESFTENLVKPKGGRPSVEYHLTLDMAKELAMVENNEKGREVRRYFIRCEKHLYKSDSNQREILVKACTKLSVNNSKVSDIYLMVGKHFGFDDGIKNIPAPLLPEAIEFVYEMIVARQKVKATTQMNIGGDLYQILSRTLIHTSDYAKQTYELGLIAGSSQSLIHRVKEIKELYQAVLTYVDYNGIKNKQGLPMYQDGTINNYNLGGVVLPHTTVNFMR